MVHLASRGAIRPQRGGRLPITHIIIIIIISLISLISYSLFCLSNL